MFYQLLGVLGSEGDGDSNQTLDNKSVIIDLLRREIFQNMIWKISRHLGAMSQNGIIRGKLQELFFCLILVTQVSVFSCFAAVHSQSTKDLCVPLTLSRATYMFSNQAPERVLC